MYSSRMRTTRLFTVYRSILGGEGGCRGGVRGVSAQGVSVHRWGVSVHGGVSARGCVSQTAMGQTPPCEQNHRQVVKTSLAGRKNDLVNPINDRNFKGKIVMLHFIICFIRSCWQTLAYAYQLCPIAFLHQKFTIPPKNYVIVSCGY